MPENLQLLLCCVGLELQIATGLIERSWVNLKRKLPPPPSTLTSFDCVFFVVVIVYTLNAICVISLYMAFDNSVVIYFALIWPVFSCLVFLFLHEVCTLSTQYDLIDYLKHENVHIGDSGIALNCRRAWWFGKQYFAQSQFFKSIAIIALTNVVALLSSISSDTQRSAFIIGVNILFNLITVVFVIKVNILRISFEFHVCQVVNELTE